MKRSIFSLLLLLSISTVCFGNELLPNLVPSTITRKVADVLVQTSFSEPDLILFDSFSYYDLDGERIADIYVYAKNERWLGRKEQLHDHLYEHSVMLHEYYYDRIRDLYQKMPETNDYKNDSDSSSSPANTPDRKGIEIEQDIMDVEEIQYQLAYYREKVEEYIRITSGYDDFITVYTSATKNRMPVWEYREGLPEIYDLYKIEQIFEDRNRNLPESLTIYYNGPVQIFVKDEFANSIISLHDSRIEADLDDLQEHRFNSNPLAEKYRDSNLQVWDKLETMTVDEVIAQDIDHLRSSHVIPQVPYFRQGSWNTNPNLFPAGGSCVVMAAASALFFYDHLFFNMVPFGWKSGNNYQTATAGFDHYPGTYLTWEHPHPDGTEATQFGPESALMELAFDLGYRFEYGGTSFTYGNYTSGYQSYTNTRRGLDFSYELRANVSGQSNHSYAQICTQMNMHRPMNLSVKSFSWQDANSFEYIGGHRVAIVGYDDNHYIANESIGVYTNGSGDFDVIYWNYANLTASNTGSYPYTLKINPGGDSGTFIPGPNLYYPVEDWTYLWGSLDFNWQHMGAWEYRIQVSNDSDFSNYVIDDYSTISFYTADHIYVGDYYWRVATKNLSGEWCEFSETGTFRVSVPDFVISPQGVNFGNVAVGSSSEPETLIVTNEGGPGTCEVYFYTNTDHFTILSGEGTFYLEYGATHEIEVAFTPQLTGDHVASIYVDEVDNYSHDSAYLSGTGLVPGELGISPQTHHFGNLDVGETSATHTFTVTNIGELGVSAEISLNFDTGDFNITSGGGQIYIPAGSSRYVEVCYTPQSLGYHYDYLDVEDNEGILHSYSTLTGTAVILNPPEDLSAMAGNSFVLLNWSAPPPDRQNINPGVSGTSYLLNSQGNRTLHGYNIYRDGILINQEYVTDTFYEDSDVVNGVLYSYYAIAVYSEGDSEPSETVAIAPYEILGTATYTLDDIPTTRASSADITPASNAIDPGNLTITVPEGVLITGVDVQYDMTAHNAAWMSDQRSFVRCVSPGGESESQVYTATGANSEGTASYSRSGLNIANNVSGGGMIDFELHAFRVWGGSEGDSDTDYNYVDDISWTVTVHYLTPDLDDDMMAESITGSEHPVINTPATYTVRVRNMGHNVQDNYTVRLMKEGGIELDSETLNFSLAAYEYIDVDLFWTPDAEGAVYLYGEVELSGDQNPANDLTVPLDVLVVGEPLAGTYDIDYNGTGNYTSISEAVAHMELVGIAGQVIFNVAPGIYEEQVVINQVAGTSEVNTISFIGMGENPQDTEIYFENMDTANRHLVKLNGAEHLHLTNMTFTAGENASYGYLIHIQNDSKYIEITDNIFNNVSSIVATHVHIVVSNSSLWNGAGNSHDILIADNVFNSGYSAVRMNGETANPLTGIEIRNNSINDVYFNGIYLLNNYAPLLESNSIHIRSAAPSTEYGAGIYLSHVHGPFLVSKNIITDPGQYGIYLSDGVTNPAERSRIVNNSIGGGFRNTGNLGGGIRILGIVNNLDIFYNSFNSDFGDGAALNIRVNTVTGLDIRNNSFVYSGGGSGYSVYIEDAATPETLDYNNYHSNGNNFVYYDGNILEDLIALQSVNQPENNDQNSLQGDPLYTATTDLLPFGPQLLEAAIPLAGIEVDITGSLRDPEDPSIGAYEFSVSVEPVCSIVPDSLDFGLIWIGATSEPQTFTITNTGLGILTLSPDNILLDNNDNFTLTNITETVDLEIGESAAVEVIFTPSGETLYTATLFIDDGLTGARVLHEIPLNGEGVDTIITDLVWSEGYEDDFPPLGWTVVSGVAGADWEQNDFFSFAGNYSARTYQYFETGYQADEWLITPPIDFDLLGDIWFTFFGYSAQPPNGEREKMRILILDTLYDNVTDLHANATELSVEYFADSWQEHSVDIRGESGLKHIAFNYHITEYVGDNWMYVDEVHLQQVEDYEVGLTNLSGNLYVPAGTSDIYYIEVENRGSENDIYELIILEEINRDDIELSITAGERTREIFSYDHLPSVSLNAGETAIVELEVTLPADAVYGEAELITFSALSQTAATVSHEIEITTIAIGLVMLPYMESFSNVALNDIPVAWERTQSNWGVQNSDNAGGEIPEMRFYFYPLGQGEFKLETPQIDKPHDMLLNLSFRHAVNNFSTPGIYNLKVQSSNDGIVWNDEWSIEDPDDVSAEMVNIEISHVTGDTFYLAWVFDGNTSDINQWDIDDISIWGVMIELDQPQVTAAIFRGIIHLNWEAVENANSYKVYASDDPYADYWGEPVAIIEHPGYSEAITEERKFFKVIASTEEPPALRDMTSPLSKP